MKHLAIFLAFGFGVFSAATAQTAVSVSTGAGFVNDVYYSLANGEVATPVRAGWDLAFSISASSGIRANHAAGTSVFVVSSDTSDWATLDTTGLLTATNELHNSVTGWMGGALNQAADTSDFFDIGWGLYNIQTHVVTGSRLFVVTNTAGEYFKVWIQQRASGVYTFRTARLDGTAETTHLLNTADYAGKNFVYFQLSSTGTVVDREPANTTWDLLFTNYEDPIDVGGGQVFYYPSGGVLSNAGVEIAEVSGVAGVDALEDTTGAPWSTDLNVLGADWKSFTGTGFVIEDSLVYFVRAVDGSAWKVVMTGYGGTGTGTFDFTQKQLGTTSRNGLAPQVALEVYPNPAAQTATLVLDIPKPTTVSVTLRDAAGRTVAARAQEFATGLQTLPLDVAALPAGVYLVEISGDGFRNLERLVVAR